MEHADIYLGSNLIRDCEATLIVNGVEVFRLWERDSHGRLMVDFDLRDEAGERIARIAKNNVVFTAEGYEVESQPLLSRVKDSSGQSLASVEELGERKLKVTGEFWIEGFRVLITDDELVAGRATIRGNQVDGARRAIVLKPGMIMLGQF